RPGERVDRVTERRLCLLLAQRERDRPDDLLDHGHVAEPAAKALLPGRIVAGRGAQAERHTLHLLAALAAELDRLLGQQIPCHDRSLSFVPRRFLVRRGMLDCFFVAVVGSAGYSAARLEYSWSGSSSSPTKPR